MRHRSVTYSTEATFGALADPTRRAVLDLLRRGAQPAGQIARAFPISRPAISKHLRLLRRAHLVEERREGRLRVYQLNPEPLRSVDSWLEHTLDDDLVLEMLQDWNAGRPLFKYVSASDEETMRH